MSYSQGHLTAARVRLEAWQPPQYARRAAVTPLFNALHL